MRVMIIGPHGVGTGTPAALLGPALGVPHMCTGDPDMTGAPPARSCRSTHRPGADPIGPRLAHRRDHVRGSGIAQSRPGAAHHLPEGAPVLTLANAAVILNREPVAAFSVGYTRTMHHSTLIEPGDLWRPSPDEHPHVVGSIDHFDGRLTITDQDGQTYHYPSDGLLPTAVPDSAPAGHRLPRHWIRAAPRRRRRKEHGAGQDATD